MYYSNLWHPLTYVGIVLLHAAGSRHRQSSTAAVSLCLYMQQVDIAIIDDSQLQWPYTVVVVASSL